MAVEIDIFNPQISVVPKGLEGKSFLVYGTNRTGKALLNGSPIQTPTGEVAIESLKIGDEVFAVDGTVSRVVGVYPQGTKDIYDVCFTDDTVIQCSGDHLWTVVTHKKAVYTKTAEELFQTPDLKYKYSVPKIGDPIFPPRDIKIHPRLLGLLLGDGCITSRAIAFSNSEEDVINSFKELMSKNYPETVVVRGHEDNYDHRVNNSSSLIRDLQYYGLFGAYSFNKFVPDDYKYNTKEVRLDVLSGIFDTDGHVTAGGSKSISTTSEKLRDDIVWLVSSLGGKAWVAVDSREDRQRNCYAITFTLQDNVAKSKKHLSRMESHPKVFPENCTKAIREVIKAGNGECTCIAIDHPSHLYLTRNFTPTHNTTVGCQFPKPFYLGFENGINAISGIPFVPINNWSNFLKIVKQLTKPDTLDKVRDLYQTIIFDTLEAAARYCEEYVCAKFGVDSVASGRGGYGLWKELSVELWKPLNQLTSCGFTTYFIAHDGTREFTNQKGEKYEKIYPRGEKRLVDPCVDLCDFIIYTHPNGMDENGKEIPSSAYCKNTNEYHAGSRFRFMPEDIFPFTAENLQKAVAEAVEKEEQVTKRKAVDYSQQKETLVTKKRSLEDLQGDIRKIAMALAEQGKGDAYKQVVENYLGVGGSVKEATAAQTQQLELILDDIKDLM